MLELSVAFDGENNPVAETKYVYENKRLVSTEEVNIANGKTEFTTFTYDKENMVKETITETNGATKEIRYTYDRYGNVLSKTEESSKYTLYNYTYKTKKVPVLK